MDNENESLERCRSMIEQALNWGPSSGWSNLDFDSLSDRILQKTHERLSISTLKRIWGKVRYDSSPTLATLNVLARFLDFENWRDFHFRTSAAVITAAPPEISAGQVPVERPGEAKRRNVGRRRIGVMIATVAVSAAVVVFLLAGGKTPPESEIGIVFKSRKVSDELPNTVVFTYDIGSLQADSVLIQQSWDPQRRQRVSPTGKHHTSIYYRPGYFIAKLIVNDQIKKEDTVFIKTQGWKGIIDGKLPVYLSATETRQPGGLGIANTTLREKTGSPVFTGQWTNFSNVREFGLNESAFTLDVTLRNTSTVEECLCRGTRVTLLTKGGAIVIPLSAKGCISSLNLLTPSQFLKGEEHDLSAFGCDFKDFQHVQCVAATDSLKIFVNDTLAFQEKLPAQRRDLVGIRIAFEGTGEIQHVKLSGPGKVVLDDRFD